MDGGAFSDHKFRFLVIVVVVVGVVRVRIRPVGDGFLVFSGPVFSIIVVRVGVGIRSGVVVRIGRIWVAGISQWVHWKQKL